ncbi:MAG: hypothetical protein WA672_03630 [Candidatus Angelobacter sp.]
MEGAALFHQTPPPVACYDGTMLPDEINRQCTPSQLRVKPRSTGKWLKEQYLPAIKMHTTRPDEVENVQTWTAVMVRSMVLVEESS